MTADARAPGRSASAALSIGSRLLGLGSIFGKTLRDSRRAVLVVGLLAGLVVIASAGALASQFPSVAMRLLLLRQTELLPVTLRGLLGEPIAIDTLGGFLSWRVINSLPVVLGIWSVLALSGTLAGEASRGSLELVASTPVPRRRIALEKLLAHVVAVVVAMLMAAALTWIAGLAFGSLPGDEIPLTAAIAHFALTGLLMLLAGTAAFAAGPALGRGRAAGVGFIVLFGGYLIPAYTELSPLIEAVAPISPFAWTENHRPLAGRSDWAPVGLLAGTVVVLATTGVVAFDRRDLGGTARLRWLRLPGLPAGVRNPFVRQLSDRTAAAIAWGLGIGLHGAVIAASADAFAEGLAQLPQIRALIERLYPGVDITSPSGALQLGFFSFAALLAGLGGAMFAAGWAGDENHRRLQLVLSAPISRVRWAIQSGLGSLAGSAIMAAVAAVLVGLAVAGQGGDPARPLIGLFVLALYAGAVAGIGIAVGGLARADLAAVTAGGVVIWSYLIELIGSILGLPDWFLGLSLNHHLGRPIVGQFDPFGLTLMTVLAFGGLIVGAWGLRRRDVA